jgi:hypothetical protein
MKNTETEPGASRASFLPMLRVCRFMCTTDQFSQESVGMSACYMPLHFISVGHGSPVVKQCSRESIFRGHFISIHISLVVMSSPVSTKQRYDIDAQNW